MFKCSFLPKEEMELPSLQPVKTKPDKALKNNSLILAGGMYEIG